jgi:hypothetical protein
MMSAIDEMRAVETLYEALARAIDEVRDGLDAGAAQEAESRFLVKLAFLGLRAQADVDQGLSLIRRARARRD